VPPLPATPERSPATIAAELADLERYLRETPPHNEGGVRGRLEQRRTTLQRELAAARARHAGGPER
jgi:hypothetical protein